MTEMGSLKTKQPLTPCWMTFSVTSTQVNLVFYVTFDHPNFKPMTRYCHTGLLSFAEFSTGVSLAALAR